MEKKLLDAFAALGNSIAAAVPRLAVGMILIVLGVIVAKLIEVTLRTMLLRVHFDALMTRAGVIKALQRIGLRQRPSSLFPRLAYLLVLVLLARTASDAFGLIAISSAIGAFFAYLPNVMAALSLLILGTSVGHFAGRMATQAAEASGLDSAPALGKLVSALIIFLVAMMAIGQLKIDTGMVRIVTSFVLGAAALGFGLAFGLGTWDVVRNIAAGFYTRKFLTIGRNLTIAGHNGTLAAITPTHTILSKDGYEITVANAEFLKHTSVQRLD
jgi:Mechanosensitive ion channel